MATAEMPTAEEAWEDALSDMTPGERLVVEAWRGALQATAIAADEIRSVFPERSMDISGAAYQPLTEALHEIESAWLRLNGLAHLIVGDDYAEALRDEDPTPLPIAADAEDTE